MKLRLIIKEGVADFNGKHVQDHWHTIVIIVPDNIWKDGVYEVVGAEELGNQHTEGD